MEGVGKRGLFIFGILVLFTIMFTGSSDAMVTCSSSDQIILRLSGATNAHGEVYNGAGNYADEICYDTIFGAAGSGNRACTGSNKVVGLSGSTNAHAENPNLNNYATDVCYGDLSCTARTGSCLTGESLVLSLSSSTNAHLARDSSYSQNICCSIGAPPPGEGVCGDGTIQSPNGDGINEQCDDGNTANGDGCSSTCQTEDPGNCTLTSASWSATEAIEGSLVNLDVVTSGCSDGIIMSFEVWEDDVVGDDPVSINPLNRIISGNSATGTWTAEWQEDASGDPEYYFIATISSTGENMQSSNLLTVTLPPPSDPVILCSDYTDQTSCESDIFSVAEFSVEEIIGDDAFCENGDITCLCEWNVTGSVCNAVWEELDVPTGGTCGNGEIDPGEQCDGSDWGAITSCEVFSLEDGTLSCGTDCLFDTSGCIGESGVCGDNNINPGETCDGSDWGLILSCTDFDAFNTGELNCNSNCKFDTIQCSIGSTNPPIGTCTYTSTTTGSCETDGFLSSSWTALWTGSSSSREASCVDGTKVIECPAQIPLSFFNLYNMLITLLAIAGIYGILSLKKKL